MENNINKIPESPPLNLLESSEIQPPLSNPPPVEEVQASKHLDLDSSQNGSEKIKREKSEKQKEIWKKCQAARLEKCKNNSINTPKPIKQLKKHLLEDLTNAQNLLVEKESEIQKLLTKHQEEISKLKEIKPEVNMKKEEMEIIGKEESESESETPEPPTKSKKIKGKKIGVKRIVKEPVREESSSSEEDESSEEEIEYKKPKSSKSFKKPQKIRYIEVVKKPKAKKVVERRQIVQEEDSSGESEEEYVRPATKAKKHAKTNHTETNPYHMYHYTVI